MKILIDFENSATNSEIENFLSCNGLEIVKIFDSFEKLYLVSGPTVPTHTDIVREIVPEDILDIKPLDYNTVTILKSEDNDWWKFASISSPTKNLDHISVSRLGGDAIVYLMDSGVEISHSEFSESTISNLFSFNNDAGDYNGHGTAIASVLCGKTCALSAPIVKSVKVFQQGVNTTIIDLMFALEAVGIDAANTPNKFHVLNISWGIDKNAWLESKLRELILKNIVVVAAAGNSGVSIENITPASMPDVFTVGAFNSNLTSCNFTNYVSAITNTNNFVNNGNINVWAPGQDIMVAVPGGTYGQAGGTSIAAGVHSAAVAYNSFYLLNNGQPGTLDHQILNYISIGNKDFLSLDEVYTTADNFMTVFYTSYNGIDVIGKKDFTVELLVENDVPFEKVLFLRNMFKSISVLNTLPEGITIDGLCLKGKITGESNSTSLYDFVGIDHVDNSVNFKVQITLKSALESQEEFQHIVRMNAFAIFENSSFDDEAFK